MLGEGGGMTLTGFGALMVVHGGHKAPQMSGRFGVMNIVNFDGICECAPHNRA